jgi:hypothetical protein
METEMLRGTWPGLSQVDPMAGSSAQFLKSRSAMILTAIHKRPALDAWRLGCP